jgi:F-type H+-transporting ATPase subunit b
LDFLFQERAMPQLDISTWPPQLIWLAITFGFLYLVVSRLIIPKTGGVIEERKNTIEGDLAAATAAKADSEAALKAYEKSLADARANAQSNGASVRNKMSAEADAARHKLEAELSAKAAAADKAIQAAKTKAMGGIADVAVEIANNIVSELSGAKATKADLAAAVAKAAK